MTDATDPAVNDDGPERPDDPSQRHSRYDPAVARAGAAVKARRELLGYTGRKLQDDEIIGQSNLVAFEAGRQWPRDSTRAKLEKALKWAPGTITRIRQGGPIPAEPDETTAVIANDTVPVSIFLDALKLTLSDVKDQMSKLPPVTTPTFTGEATALLMRLRQVQTTAAGAARRSKGSGIALLLSDVRRTYNDLIIRAAAAPGAPLSHRLYAARHLAELTVDETANAAGVDAQTIIDVEEGRPIAADAAAALEALIAQLTER
jgi:transcriptional regulator with XRE-family HTH domain